MVVKDGRDVDLMAVPRRVWGGQTDVDEWIDLEPLTEGEHAILRLLARGMTSKEIGTELGLATNSARTYAQSLLSKLNAKNRIQALAIAQRLRLV